MSKEPRYFVNSEHVRGERRMYCVCDRRAHSGGHEGSFGVPVAGTWTTSERSAERKCAKLNAAELLNNQESVK